MRTDLIIAGVGGQGSLMAGTLLGTAAVVFDNKKALQTQSYSSELRGGAAVTWVIVSDEDIVYPRVVDPDVLVAQALLTDTETNYFNALYDFKIAKAVLYRAIGQDKYE